MAGASVEPFYGAAARSMSESWHDFIFGAFDPAWHTAWPIVVAGDQRGPRACRGRCGAAGLGPGAPVSVSAGVAANPPHGTTAEELHRAAGEALMRAKRDGRDRVAMYVEEKMVLKSNYYSKANLERLAKLSSATDRTEASLLREALDDLLDKHKDAL
jgi:hypothetical protein